MIRKPLLWQLFPSFVVVTALSLAAVTWYATSSLRDFYQGEVRADLEARARLLEEQVLACLDTRAVDALCKDLGKRSATRITVILKSGKVVGDSEEDPAEMENHATPDRPEVVAALGGTVGTARRHSATLDKNMMYLAIPLKRGDAVIGTVRTALPLTAIDATLEGVHRRLAWAGLAVGVVAALLSMWISRRVSKPLGEMKRGAEGFARGELDSRLAVPETEELASLAEAMNQMATQLGERLRTITEQRNEQEAILASMVEGVLAVDTEERLISINRAAAQMLAVDLPAPEGRSIQEAVRNVALQRFVARTLSEPGPTEGEVVLTGDREVVLQAHGAALRDVQGHRTGAVIVLNDVTRVRRLENVRRDFVANVSHELRTPITSVKAAVETLLDGALSSPDDARRFAGIIAKQVDRLNALIEDLLLLSRIEQDKEPGISLERSELGHILQSAVQTCSAKAAEKSVSVAVQCRDDLAATVNPPLLEQAVVNLVDNAVKYSEPGSLVEVTATGSGQEILIAVTDRGCGIEKEHLSRIFERFYRVDKARSRKLGGTGLGLAIVKHIAQAHHGQVTVESTPGQGSVFTIHLPRE
jgi:two-component system phosphate regulon sensor histidine kinase PhoR